MIMNEYEALGRYIDGKERLERLKKSYEMNCHLIDSNSLKLPLFIGNQFKKNEAENAIENIEILLPRCKNELIEIDALITEINQYAELCGKPKI